MILKIKLKTGKNLREKWEKRKKKEKMEEKRGKMEVQERKAGIKKRENILILLTCRPPKKSAENREEFPQFSRRGGGFFLGGHNVYPNKL